MIELKIRGHSDDIVSYKLDDKSDELNPPNTDGPYMGTLLVHSDKGRCLVHALYDGCWSFAVSKVDECDEMTFQSSSWWEDYSEVLSLMVPKGTKLDWKK
jgi:hypothetical protein